MILLALIGMFATMILSPILRGWVLTILWGWFAVPFGLPVLNIPTAIGVALIVSYLTHQTVDAQPKEESAGEKFATAVVMAFVGPFLTLGFGLIVHKFQ